MSFVPLGRPRALLRALDRHERAIRLAWFDAVDNVRAAATWTRISGSLEQGDVADVAEALLTRAMLTGVLQEMRAAYVGGAETVQNAVPRTARSPAGGRLLFRFDIMDPAAEAWLRNHSSTLVVQILEDQREAVRLVLGRGMELGQNARRTALDIVGRVGANGRRTGGIIGLAPNQTQWVLNARAQLLSGDPEQMRAYLRRVRRDKRFDRSVLAAIREGRALPVSMVDRIVGRYSDKLLDLRGQTIARTESIQAFAAGRHESFRQLKDVANLSDQDMERGWDATGDIRTREDHIEMDGQIRKLEEPFEAPDGSLLNHPGDTSLGADASQIINCRCLESLKVDFVTAEARRNRGG